MRAIGTSFASAIAGVVLAQMTIDFGGQALPSENSFRVVMAIGAGSALLALALASFLRRGVAVAKAPVGGRAEAAKVSRPV
jgi:hypothetical protein